MPIYNYVVVDMLWPIVGGVVAKILSPTQCFHSFINFFAKLTAAARAHNILCGPQ
jgi:hypothetical protein